jgi:hypothetical protein
LRSPFWMNDIALRSDDEVAAISIEAAGVLLAELDWYLVGAVARGGEVELDGLDDPVTTLAEARAAGHALTPDKVRLAIELTAGEKRNVSSRYYSSSPKD